MADFHPTAEQERVIEELLDYYEANQGPIKRFLESLHVHVSESGALAGLTHSVKRRMKSRKSLRDKLIRKLQKDVKAGVEFHINKGNLFTEITDLGGYRILHLHTRQMDDINKALVQVLEEAQCTVIEGPKANVWDKETETYFQGIGISTDFNPRLYSSVHYIVSPHKSKANVRVEIQIRSLSEEIWGEVDHKFNYPYEIKSVACGEQIKVLARVASSCTRLVDSIFASVADFTSMQPGHESPPSAVPAPEPAQDEQRNGRGKQNP
jgi:putative GTP pyrophosphokinase